MARPSLFVSATGGPSFRGPRGGGVCWGVFGVLGGAYGLRGPRYLILGGGKHMKNRVRQPVHIEPKGWGREVWLANNELYCGKILEINKGKRCSLHFHKLKTESFFLRAGRLRVTIKESAEAGEIEQFILNPGECMDIPPGLVHQMEALEDAELYEFSTQHFNSDSHRLVKGD